MKQKYNVYQLSELKIRGTGNKFDIPQRLLPVGTPLFGVYTQEGENIYPRFGNGESKESCQRWLKENCWLPRDRPYPLKIIKSLIPLDRDQKIDGLMIMLNEVVYEGNIHSEFNLVFKDKKNYFQFDYIQGQSGFFYPGRWMKPSFQIDSKNYLCKRVYLHERIIIRRDFTFDNGES